MKHKTWEEARSHRVWLRKTKGANDDLVIYECGDHWHVGHNKQKLQDRIRTSIRKRPRQRRR